MRDLKLVLAMCSLLSFNVIAAEGDIKNGIGVGIQLNQYQNDFGMGLNLTTPYFYHNSIAVRLRTNVVFNQYIDNNETIWTPYSNVSIGLVGIKGKVTNNIRVYSEGGVIGLFPSNKFSTKSFEFGGYGLLGFEFYTNENTSHFIEVGGVGTGAKSDKVSGKPIYSNGLLISAGVKKQF